MSVGELSENPNGPQITSTPPLVAAILNPYLYQPVAFDRDGDVLTWSLVDGPTTMAIDPATGRILWTPGAADVGVHTLAIEVSDGDNAATQLWDVTVTATQPNLPPRFASSPPATAVVGAPLAYDAEAIDPEAGTVTYALASGPGSVHPTTGVLSWTPSSPGVTTLAIRATDPMGASATQTFYVLVRDANTAPVITSGAAQAVLAGGTFEHRVTAFDADGDTLTFTLVSGPAGLVVDPATGNVAWGTAFADVGSHAVQVRVTDPFGGSALASFDAVVITEDTAPSVLVTADQATACVDLAVRVCVNASDDIAVTGTGLSIDGELQTLDALGCVFVTPTVPGTLDLQGVAADGSDNTGFGSLFLDVIDCSTILGPVVSILTPDDGARLGAPIGVLGEAVPASAATIESWNLTIRRGDDAEVVLAGGSGDLPASTLATFDTTLIENGLWTLRLEATDSFGRVGFDEAALVVDGDLKLGAYDLAFVDAEWHASAAPISVGRSYTTLRKDIVGDFGHGWELSVSDFEVWTNGPLGDGGWSQVSCGGGMIFLPICYETARPHVVVVKWPGGAIEAFDMTPQPGSTFFAPLTSPAYEARLGAFSTLSSASPDAVMFVGDGNLYNGLGGTDVYDPQRFLLTSPDGMRYLLDVVDGLVETTDLNGNKVRYTDSGIFPDHGIGVSWTRDALGRIDAMHLPGDDVIAYAYDAAGDLVGVTDEAGRLATFEYDGGHRLVAYQIDGESPVAEMVYDTDGRLIAETDPSGVFVALSANLSTWTETVTGPDPGLVTAYTFDVDGLLVSTEQTFTTSTLSGDVVGVGPASRMTSFGYDAQRLLTSYTDANGGVSTFAYDSKGRVTRAIDADGVVRGWTYDGNGHVTQATAGGEVLGTYTYEDEKRLSEIRSPTGDLVASYAYNTWGGLVSWTDGDGVGGSLRYGRGTYNGQPISALPDLVEGVTIGTSTMTFELDAVGTAVAVTDGTGGTSRSRYDTATEEEVLTDANGGEQVYGFDSEGNWVEYRDKAGRSDTVAYDAASQPITADTRGGEQLSMAWDQGRVATVTGPDTWVSYQYDSLGRVTQVANPETTIDLVWESDDDLQAIVSSGWAFGPLVQRYDWTDAGRYAGSSSRFGAVTQAYDHLGRPSTLSDPYTGDVAFGYTADGRLGSVSRSTGLQTTFGYTDAGRWASIDTVLGADVLEATRYAWDADGKIEMLTDGEGDHAYAWDAAGRLVGADHPVGSALTDEAYAYDANGNRTAWGGNAASEVTTNAQDQLLTDAGFAYAYDLDGRLVSKTDRVTNDATVYAWNSFAQLVRVGYADGGETTFRYDGLGRRLEVNHRGEVRRFVWDLEVLRAVLDGNDALVAWSSTDPWGALLSEWDAVAGTAEEALSNPLMTVTGVVDASGNAVRVPRDSFGNAPGGPSGGYEPYAVTWHGMDPSGLVYARGRYLDPQTGRFLSEDPVSSENLYTYAGNNPLTAWDPTGAMVAVEYNMQSDNSAKATAPSSTRVGINVGCTLLTNASALGALDNHPMLGLAIDVGCAVAQRGRPP